MKPSPLALLLVLNAALLGAIYLAAGPAPEARAQFANGGGARYTMIAAQTDGTNDEATVYLIDLQTTATVPIHFVENRNRFELARGRVISQDAATLAGTEGVIGENNTERRR